MLTRINFLTAGESHGRGLLGIIEGIPSGLEISKEYIDVQLKRRQMGHGRGGRMKIENDAVEIWSGVRDGKTIASPIGLIVRNKDWENWKNKMSVEKMKKTPRKVTLPRPGHADLAGVEKYGFDDIRNVLERSSARETTMRVALASICRKLLGDIGIHVASRVVQIHNIVDFSPIPGKIKIQKLNELVDKSPVRCLNGNIEKEMIQVIDHAKSQGDSVGGVFEVVATGIPYGLGSYTQWNKKLQTKITSLMMSVNAYKAIEIGSGFNSGEKFGSEIHDEIEWNDKRYTRSSNNAGGIEGGMSNAMPITIRIAMKPIPTLTKSLKSVDIVTKEQKNAHKERTDSCAVPAASIIAESMLCYVLADTLLEKFGGDSMEQLMAHMKASAKY